MKKIIKILTYNIHKGFNSFNTKFILKNIRDSILDTKADILCIQEVVGENRKNKKKWKDWPAVSQFEYLADSTWPHFAYGKNAVYSSGHHGNAILSKYPIVQWENINISTNRLEQRGLLHAEILLSESRPTLHVLCTHLNLLARSRKKQMALLGKRIQDNIPSDSPMILAGDFNDWKENLSTTLCMSSHLQEALSAERKENYGTYPCWFPKLKLDRIFYKNIEVATLITMQDKPWNQLSDHLPVLAELKINF